MFIAIGKSRFDKRWKNEDISWSSFINKLQNTYRTRETLEEFKKSTKAKQGEIKDVGGFVGGKLKDGRRINGNVLSRSMLTLDLDFAPLNFWDTYSMLNDFTSCMYSTHSHASETPRYRLILPLSREVLSDEYEAIARKLAEEVGIDYFDDTTYQASRLMYWPSTSSNADYIFEQQEGSILNADTYLSKYDDWKDISFWPTSSRSKELTAKNVEKQEDPLSKEGLVGAFCRTYSITSAIDTFLSEIYVPCDNSDRYTYINGSSAAGLAIYEDRYAFSNHATDPCSMKLCNAFDLVRLHLFGHLDLEAKEGTPDNRRPSAKAMRDFVNQDSETKKTIGIEKIEDAKEEFTELLVSDMGWTKQLEMERGEFASSISNVVMILENDINVKNGIGGVDLFANKVVKSGKLPWGEYDHSNPCWTDDDDANMRYYIEKVYNIHGRSNILDAQRIVHKKNSFNPLKDYLDTCAWDGIARLDTLFIDFLGVEDSEYTRMVTRKALSAAVKRVYVPGCKFDYMVVLYGLQGVGKSQILSRLGMGWFTDNLKSFRGKEAQEVIQGQWIVELSELSALKRNEVEESKQFISMQVDRYRKPYDRNTTDSPRTCVFFGTTNSQEFLKDNTGNRRYWPLDVNKKNATKNMWKELDPLMVKQIWAEAKFRFESQEPMWLGEKLEKVAWEHQEAHRETDSRKEDVMEYLDTLLPANWYELDLLQRREFLEGDMGELEGTMQRDRVYANEIIEECLYRFGAKIGNIYDVKDVNAILRETPNWEYKKSLRFKGVKLPRKGFIRT